MIPIKHHNESEHRRLIAGQVNQITPVVKDITLTALTTSTAVTDERCGEDSQAVLTPTNSSGSTVTYYVTHSNGSFTINHSSPATDATFRYYLV